MEYFSDALELSCTNELVRNGIWFAYILKACTLNIGRYDCNYALYEKVQEGTYQEMALPERFTLHNPKVMMFMK